MDIGDIFSVSPITLKGLHKGTLNFSELFWDIKMEISIFGKIQKLIAAKM